MDRRDQRVPPLMDQATARSEGARHEAFDRLVVPELGVLLHVARTLTPTEADAEDLVQDTLLRAFRSIERFDGAHVRAWLFTIMRNAQINRVRRRRPELLDDADDIDVLAPPDGGRSPEEAAEARAFDEAVAAALSHLPPKMAHVVELIDIDGLSCPEAAVALGVPVGTVMSRLHRARRKVRDRLARDGFAPRGGMW
ncbi:MAG: sigma-70 family RNA polymerase sigma factor [Actinomycetota bacterium]|nr:sigma-70 family RNA polymerase sigma factor [Actinomycetota bacterium]